MVTLLEFSKEFLRSSEVRIASPSISSSREFSPGTPILNADGSTIPPSLFSVKNLYIFEIPGNTLSPISPNCG